MKKRFLERKATTDEIFTELMKRVRMNSDSALYLIDRTTVAPYPTWSLHSFTPNSGKYIVHAKEVKE